ncbi:glycoside hydrolase family 6 protein [Streptomyces sp. LX-29]|uniref:glycoside hydrolase family 6 protein n=1 Tax=Streptomyces sp. LX-29 TaxID=2900152 RepID=UPI00240E7A95|nr:glycoside hydrolase family 6 protein [Streptomyces sp. LX-29]WFB10343.1 glycoside hydrolase family 6 protein [Streptomyces sp. LX-29]
MVEKGTRHYVARSRIAATAALVLSLSLSGCSDSGEKSDGLPSELWVNPDSQPARTARQYVTQGRHEDAALMRKIADQPAAEWVGELPRARARAVTTAAARTGRTPVLVAYHIPYRDCGRHSAGGAEGAPDYGGWVRELAAGIGDRSAVVILEPDAVAQVVDGCVPGELREERLAMLRNAVETLKALPRTWVYIDAGNAGWVRDPYALVEPLKQSGIDKADGFSLNVSNFQPTGATIRYGHHLSGSLGGAHFVIDTSRNGNGATNAAGSRSEAYAYPGHHEDRWCNPPGRALGERPGTRTGDPKVDAFLWVKRPGESDGTCNGGPAAGSWWPRYALDLARNTRG